MFVSSLVAFTFTAAPFIALTRYVYLFIYLHQKELRILVQSVYGFDVANDVDLFI